VYFLVRWLINIAALFAVIHTVSGVSTDNAQTVVVAALIIGLLNAFLRPLIVAVTLPLSILTLGFFTLIINASIFYLASQFVRGFVVSGFWTAFWASIVFSVVSFILNVAVKPGAGFSVNYFRHGAAGRAKYDDVIDVEGEVVDPEEDDSPERLWDIRKKESNGE
jgi:putative membrane protein